MAMDLLIGILASVIASGLVGGAIYKVVVNKKNKNKGIDQGNGDNQIALQKSNNNSINIGVGLSGIEKRNKSE